MLFPVDSSTLVMTNSPNVTPADPDIDTVLRLFADRTCRDTIAHLTAYAQQDTISVDAIAAALPTAREDARSTADLRTVLHHSVLPRLDDIGMIDYDTRTQTVYYWGESPLISRMRDLLESDMDLSGSAQST